MRNYTQLSMPHKLLALLQLMALTYHRARWPKVTPTHQQYGIVAKQRTSIGFKLAVRGNSGAGGLVAPLPCTAYFGKLAILFGCSLPQQA